LGALALTYVLAKRDFFVRFNEVGTTSYLAGHWGYWVAMLLFAGLARILFWVSRERVEASKSASS
jgi:hypothetical protein